MKITGISIASNSLPLDGIDYAVARITSVEMGEADNIPFFGELVYPASKERATLPVTGSQFENYGAIYTIVKNVQPIKGEDGVEHVSAELIPTLDDLFAPFEFVDDLKAECIEYFFKQRAGQLNLKLESYPLDNEDGTKAEGFLFYSLDELTYIRSSASRVEEILNPSKAAELKSDKSIEMLFADIMKKCVDIFNSENYHKQAPKIAKLIADTFVVVDDDKKRPLSISEVDEILDCVRDNLHTVSSAWETGSDGIPAVYPSGLKLTDKFLVQTISKTISDIRYFNEIGTKGPLNITAVDKMFSNIKDNLRIF